jgi:hypothetical protein
MTGTVQIVNPLSDPEWDRQVREYEQASIFHTSAWARVLCETYRYTPCYFRWRANRCLPTLVPLIEVDSRLTGVRGVSLPFTDYCRPLAESPLDRAGWFDHLVKFGAEKTWRYVELRGGRFMAGAPSSESYYVHTVDLSTGPEEVKKRLKPGTRRAIRKAREAGVFVERSETLEGLRSFYALHCLTRKRHGLPPPPFSFFRSLHEEILAKGAGFVLHAKWEGRIIASALFLHMGQQALFKYGASLKKYQTLRGNNLILWEALRWYAENGFQHVSLGRTAMTNEGLRRFKSGWGAREETLEYFRYDLAKSLFVADRSPVPGWSSRLFRWAPVPVSRLVGGCAYRHVG